MARSCSTICVPVRKDLYQQIIHNPTRFRNWLDQSFGEHPELFPKAFAHGYTLKDQRRSRKRDLTLRRIRCTTTGESFSVRPSFVLPYMVGWTDDVHKPLFLRSFGVPFWALAEVFGQDTMYWYRLEVGLGRYQIVGTTVRQVALPEHLLADEHHQSRDGNTNYIATTVGEGCCLGAAVSETAGAEDLTTAYGVFQKEADHVQPGYQPQTVNLDGWAATHQAWKQLYALVVVLRCFLHGWLNLRSRGKLSPAFAELSRQVWEAFRAQVGS